MKAASAITTLITVSLCAAARFNTPSTDEGFQLYGYNRGFGGQPVFFADGFAYVGTEEGLNATNVTHGQFFQADDGVWIVQMTSTTNDTASSPINGTFMVPAPNNEDRRVGVINGNPSPDTVTTGFRFYGSLATNTGNDGQLEVLFTGLNVTDGAQALYWNDTSLGQVPVVLRNEAPSNPLR